LTSSRALTSQLNQTNYFTSLRTTSRKLTLTIESTYKLAVVLSISRGFDSRNNLLDWLAILDGSQSTVALARLTAITLILGHNASLELILLDVQVVLENISIRVIHT
jgi:hypothetical protein